MRRGSCHSDSVYGFTKRNFFGGSWRTHWLPSRRNLMAVWGRLLTQSRKNIVEQYWSVFPAIDTDICAASECFECSMSVPVQMHCAIKNSLPRAQRIVAANDAFLAFSPPLECQQFVRVIEEILEAFA